MNEKLRLEYATDFTPAEAEAFLRLGGPYLAEIDPENATDHQRFLQSILRRQGEPDRWLTLFRARDQVVGFAHFKIDRDDRPGSGYILEFYVVPERRRQRLGKRYLSMMMATMKAAGYRMVWLASHPAAESFWRACGFCETGEFERNQRVMTRSLVAKNNNRPGKGR